MHMDRREFIVVATASALAAGRTRAQTEGAGMYGLIGRMTASPGRRDELVAILLEGTGEMPGCLSYIVATDPADENAIWITEVWDRAESHAASLSLPAVRAAIAKGRPLIASFDDPSITTPIGGVGLAT
jgi:quinol monooxygenase YgiN